MEIILTDRVQELEIILTEDTAPEAEVILDLDESILKGMGMEDILGKETQEEL